jgi:radical SAM-linked protein
MSDHVNQVDTSQKNFRYRAVYHKIDSAKVLTHLEVTRTLRDAFDQAGIPLACSPGSHQRPYLAFGPALPMNVASKYELIDFYLYRYIRPEDFLIHLNRVLPKELHFKDAAQIPKTAASISAIIDGADYSLDLTEVADQQLRPANEAIRQFDSSETVPFTKHKTQKLVNIKEFVRSIVYKEQQNRLEVEMKIIEGETVGIHQVLSALFQVELQWPVVREYVYVWDNGRKASSLTIEWEQLQMQRHLMEMMT